MEQLISLIADLSADAFKDVKTSGFFMLKDISRFLDKITTDKETRDKLTDLIEYPHRRAQTGTVTAGAQSAA